MNGVRRARRPITMRFASRRANRDRRGRRRPSCHGPARRAGGARRTRGGPRQTSQLLATMSPRCPRRRRERPAQGVAVRTLNVAAMSLAELQYLSLVSKVCTELDNHIGVSDKTLAEFIIDLAKKNPELPAFRRQRRERRRVPAVVRAVAARADSAADAKGATKGGGGAAAAGARGAAGRAVGQLPGPRVGERLVGAAARARGGGARRRQGGRRPRRRLAAPRRRRRPSACRRRRRRRRRRATGRWRRVGSTRGRCRT